MKCKKNGEVGYHRRRRLVQVLECILDKVEQLCIGFRLLDSFHQQLNHKQSHCVLTDIEENCFVQMTPPEFLQPLQVPEFVIIDDEVKLRCRLKKICSAHSFLRRSSY